MRGPASTARGDRRPSTGRGGRRAPVLPGEAGFQYRQGREAGYKATIVVSVPSQPCGGGDCTPLFTLGAPHTRYALRAHMAEMHLGLTAAGTVHFECTAK